MTESVWRVRVMEEKVSVYGLDGCEQFMNWADIKGIALEVTPGPYGSTIYWHVMGEAAGLVFPIEAEGQAEALKFFQKLPGFDSAKILEALRSSENGIFLVWKAT